MRYRHRLLMRMRRRGSLAALAILASSSMELPAQAQRSAPAPATEVGDGEAQSQHARAALLAGQSAVAASAYEQLRLRHNARVPDAGYWEAYARFRLGGVGQLRRAVTALDDQRARHPAASTAADAEALLVRTLSALAAAGDAGARARLAATVRSSSAERFDCRNANVAAQVLALRALARMSVPEAIALTSRILEPRERCPAELRRHALLVAAEMFPDPASAIFLAVLERDTDIAVRRAAVFGVGRAQGSQSVPVLDRVARSSEVGLHAVALEALADIDSPVSRRALVTYIGDRTLSQDGRKMAALLLAQHLTPDNATALENVFGSLQDSTLRRAILVGVSEQGTLGAARWLASIGRRRSQALGDRNFAIILAGERGLPVPELAGLFDTLEREQLRMTVLIMLSQRGDREAIDQLIRVARSEPVPRLRQAARLFLSESADPRAVRALRELGLP